MRERISEAERKAIADSFFTAMAGGGRRTHFRRAHGPRLGGTERRFRWKKPASTTRALCSDASGSICNHRKAARKK